MPRFQLQFTLNLNFDNKQYIMISMSSNELLKDLHSQLSPVQFETFLSKLLDEMGFSDVVVTGRSGDRGIDLEGIWTQKTVPGLQVDVSFKIQAKRLKPGTTINPKYVRELRGCLSSARALPKFS